MPQVGEIRKAEELGKRGHAPNIYCACSKCGVLRWVRCVDQYRLCPSCGREQLALDMIASHGIETKRASELGKYKSGKDIIYYNLTCPKCGKKHWTRYISEHSHCVHCRNMPTGVKHHAWKGGRNLASNGYIEILLQPDDPLFAMAGERHYAWEHRIVVAKRLGRCLKDWELVHHLNGVKTDNRDENLELVTPHEHRAWENLVSRVQELEAQIAFLKWKIGGMVIPSQAEEIYKLSLQACVENRGAVPEQQTIGSDEGNGMFRSCVKAQVNK